MPVSGKFTWYCSNPEIAKIFYTVIVHLFSGKQAKVQLLNHIRQFITVALYNGCTSVC